MNLCTSGGGFKRVGVGGIGAVAVLGLEVEAEEIAFFMSSVERTTGSNGFEEF